MFIKQMHNRVIAVSIKCLLKTLLLTMVLVILPSQLLFAQSGDAVGEVRLVIGDVSLQSAVSGTKSLELGDKIYQDDQITTPATGYAVITLVDDTKFTIKPDSIFQFQSVVNQPNGKVLTELLKGGLKAITGSIGKQNPPGFKIDSPLGSIGIRGTNLDAVLCQGDKCSLLHETLGCPQEPPEETNGLLYVTVAQGVAYLDDCENDPDIKPGQVGVTDGSASGCKVLNEVPCFLKETIWQRDQKNDETLKSLEVPVLQEQSDNDYLCQGDPICIQCQGDPNCIQCQGDPECLQCQGDPICIQCLGDPLCVQCQGDPLCVQCQGNPQCIQCQGDPLCIQCDGDPQCIQCQGDPLCVQCQGDLECVRCNGVQACIDGEDRPVINTDPCLINPAAEGCPMDPCILNPTSPSCPDDPCILNPAATNCPLDPCILDPMSAGCPSDPCVVDPNGMTCVCMINPQDPICNPPMCLTTLCIAECGQAPSLGCLCAVEPNNPICM